MRPLRIVMEAFGPFAGREVLDFRALGNRSFFLIHGPTGAGKTTILDAMCFALYGETSGPERDARSMRCNLADPALATQVIFDFSLGGETYRVQRSPEQQRPKKRGAGLISEKSSATLWQRTGLTNDEHEGKVLAVQPRKVDVEVARILGFQAGQFRQVILLPQGQFRQLLLAGSSERQAILQMLFGTQEHFRLEEALKAAAKALEEEARGTREKRAHLFEQASVTSTAELTARHDELTAQQLVLADRLAAATAVATAAQARLDAARRVHQALHERDTAAAELLAHAARVPAVEVTRARAALARKAAALEHFATAADVRAKEAKEAEERQEAATRAAALALTAREAATAAFARETAREPERESARAKVAELLEHARLAATLVEARTSVASAEKRLAAAKAARDKHMKTGETAAVALETARTQLESARTVRERLPALEIVATEARARTRRRAELTALTADHARAATARTAAATRLSRSSGARDEARAALAALESRWLAAQAQVLASRLVPGEPCSVCGSLDHPHPAVGPQTIGASAAHAGSSTATEAAGTTATGATAASATAAGTTDAGTTDAGTTDAGTTDAGTTATGATDAGATAAGATATGTTAASATAASATAASATDATDAVDDAMLAAARGTVEASEAARDAALKADNAAALLLEGLKAKLDVAREVLGEAASAEPAALETAAVAAERDLAAARADAARATALETQVGELTRQVQQAQAAADQALVEQMAANTEFDKAHALLTDRESKLPPELRDPARVEALRKAAVKLVESLSAALEAARTADTQASQRHAAADATAQSAIVARDTARTRAAETARHLDLELVTAGFADRADWERARLAAPELAELDRQIQRHDRELATAVARRDQTRAAADAALAAFEPDPGTPFDLAVHDAAALAARADRDATLGEERSHRVRVEQLATWLTEARGLDDSGAAQEARYTVLGKVSEVANGTNPQRMTFERYVLATILDQVLVAATRRLHLMSRGRYRLQRVRLHADQRTAGGLDLEVHDDFSGTLRPVSTLSGGESFLAALALALGLADVVQEHQGGIRLDTLFIDEGFGSLDPEALDLAVRALIDLQQGGRLVGVISHVPELKERIDVRLEVRADRRGSTARFET